MCEQKFARSNCYANCKAMNRERFNHYFLYLFDLNNLRTEGKVRILANPLSKKRLEAILEATLANSSVKDMENESFSPQEEVCQCTRKSKCISSRCLCFKSNKKCKPFCHPEADSKCENKS